MGLGLRELKINGHWRSKALTTVRGRGVDPGQRARSQKYLRSRLTIQTMRMLKTITLKASSSENGKIWLKSNSWTDLDDDEDAFKANESHLQEYMGNKVKIEYFYDYFEMPKTNGTLNLDLVSSVLPCAGLSTLNRTNRGKSAKQNDHMIKAAE